MVIFVYRNGKIFCDGSNVRWITPLKKMFSEFTIGLPTRVQITKILNQGPNYQDFKIRIDLSCFDGRLHIEDFLDWIHNVENFFDYIEILLDRQVKLVAYRLKGGASA